MMDIGRVPDLQGHREEQRAATESKRKLEKKLKAGTNLGAPDRRSLPEERERRGEEDDAARHHRV
jgi:hypothetical protein